MKSNYGKWDCRETVWNRQFAGKAAGGRSWPATRLNRVFFQPMYAGQTFGVGQLGPIVALSVTDLVHAKSGLPLLSIDDAPQVFSQIMNPDASMYYIAASIRVSIDNYKQIAGFDISQNAGILATLYNLGDSATRAVRSEGGQRPARPARPAAAVAAGEFLRLVRQRQDCRTALGGERHLQGGATLSSRPDRPDPAAGKFLSIGAVPAAVMGWLVARRGGPFTRPAGR